MNKKGDFPSILLVVLELILVIITLFSFASFNEKFSDNSDGRNKLLENIEVYENYLITESRIIASNIVKNGSILLTDEGLKESFKAKTREKNLGILGLEDYFRKVEEGNFTFFLRDGKYLFGIENIKIKANEKANSFERSLKIRIELDNEGNILS